MDQMIERYDDKHKGRKDRRGRWFLMGLLAIIVKYASSGHTAWVEEYYSNGLFAWVRKAQDFLFAWLGFPALYLVVPILCYQIWQTHLASQRSRAGCLFGGLSSAISSLMWLVFWFTLLWGMNYNRIPAYERLGLRAIAYQPEEIKDEMDGMLDGMLSLRAGFCLSGQEVEPTRTKTQLEKTIRPLVKETMKKLGYRPQGQPRVRELGAQGALLRWGTAGFYFPFTGECHIDKALHPLQKPFTMAHELAHGYGEGSEATCNFIAYLACRRSGDPFVRYSGELGFWRYLATNYLANHPEEYAAYRSGLPQDIVLDLDGINRNNAKYPDVMPNTRDFMYDSYLKAQGERDGNLSYGRVVEMTLTFKRQQPEHPAWK